VPSEALRELSLFTGAGGGIYGSKLLGWKTLGYVEINPFCQALIAQRIIDGIFDKAPIFTDIRLFIDRGYAKSYKGLVDVVSAGFPCQDFSRVGNPHLTRIHPKKNKWPETFEVIRLVRPRWVLLENVPNLLCLEAGRKIFGQLASIGYHGQWETLPAWPFVNQINGSRLWIVVSTARNGSSGITRQAFQRKLVAATLKNLSRYKRHPAPRVCRAGHGVANFQHRIKAVGNAQVPAMEAAAWRILK
jgi:DNA (cytosine-5)-methyltransferase 1